MGNYGRLTKPQKANSMNIKKLMNAEITISYTLAGMFFVIILLLSLNLFVFNSADKEPEGHINITCKVNTSIKIKNPEMIVDLIEGIYVIEDGYLMFCEITE